MKRKRLILLIQIVFLFCLVLLLCRYLREENEKTDVIKELQTELQSEKQVEMESKSQKENLIIPDNLSIMEEDVCYENNECYVDSQLLLTAISDAPYYMIEELVQNEGGKIIGYIGFSGDYQVDFPNGKTYDELTGIIKKWETFDYIEMLSLNHVTQSSISSVNYREDPWIDTSDDAPDSQNIEWTEERPEGSNWWAESIAMPSVWEKNLWDDLPDTPIRIGVIDSVFDEEHEDLQEVFVKTWQNTYSLEKMAGTPELSHGTHVSGIIAAKMGNGAGIAGVASCVEPQLYGFAMHGENSKFYVGIMEYKYALALMLENGVKIINISMGCDDSKIYAAQMGDTLAREEIEHFNEMMSLFLKKALLVGYDFLIVKAAGNTSDKRFIECEKSKEYPYGYKKVAVGGNTALCSAKYDIFSGIEDEEVRKHIMVVGSAELSGVIPKLTNIWCYDRAAHSNIDYDILAPGVNVLSLVHGNNATDVKQGTSMATPIVTGIAALVWTANPELSAEQVRKIILMSAEQRLIYAYSGTGSVDIQEDIVTVPNADLAVELAGMLQGKFDNNVENSTILTGVVYRKDEADDTIVRGVPGAKLLVYSHLEEKIILEKEMETDLYFDAILSTGNYSVSVIADGFIGCTTSFEITQDQDPVYLAIEMQEREEQFLIHENIYNGEELTLSYAFLYNDKQLLSGITCTDLYEGYKTNYSFVYDTNDRLIAIYDDSIGHKYKLEERIYNDNGQLMSRKYYYRGESIPDYEYNYEYDSVGNLVKRTELFKASRITKIDKYTYVFDKQGRILEKQEYTEYPEEDFVPDVYVTQYTYDSQDRIQSAGSRYIARGECDSQGNPRLENIQEYYEYNTYSYEYVPYILMRSSFGEYRIDFIDSIGKSIWTQFLGTEELDINEVNQIVGGADRYGGKYELIYGDYRKIENDAENSIKGDYKNVLKQFQEDYNWNDEDVSSLRYTLYDIDKNGIEELIVSENMLNYFVYTYEQNEVKKCGEFTGIYSNCLYQYDGNGLLLHLGGTGSMRLEHIYLYQLVNDILEMTDVLISTEEISQEEFACQLETYVPINDFYEITDEVLLKNM